MKWSADQYFTDANDGLIKRLELTSTDRAFLEKVKQTIRTRTKDVFTEAQSVVKTIAGGFRGGVTIQSVENEVKKTRLRFLDKEDIQRITQLLLDMSVESRNAFLNTDPRFWIQGSYKYKTLNKPYHLPPQQMDIDDGTYMPMEMFKDQPLVGHELLLLLVYASLSSLKEENPGWETDPQLNCGRIVIAEKAVHVDVPMYAIPREMFLKRQHAYDAGMEAITEGVISKSLKLDENCVYLAVRGKDKWIKSDPEIVASWFKKAVERHGEPMRQICRYLKAWRDVQWETAKLSSIAIMKCVVDIFDNTAMPNTTDHGELLLKVTEQLAEKLNSGVQSPDETDDGRLLFPKENMNEDTVKDIIEKAKTLHEQLNFALNNTSSKGAVLQILNGLFGKGVVREELIKPYAAIPAYQQPRQPQKNKQMSDSMTSG